MTINSETPVSLDAQIAEAERELATRRRVYPRLIKRGTMRFENAVAKAAAMAAIVETLKGLRP
jgi:hypothetical protein